MDPEEQTQSPADLLQELSLESLPSEAEIYDQIEQTFLTPHKVLPESWLKDFTVSVLSLNLTRCCRGEHTADMFS